MTGFVRSEKRTMATTLMLEACCGNTMFSQYDLFIYLLSNMHALLASEAGPIVA